MGRPFPRVVILYENGGYVVKVRDGSSWRALGRFNDFEDAERYALEVTLGLKP